MSLRPPGRHRPTEPNPLDYEIAQEMAVSLGRAGRKVEEALARLREGAGDRAVASIDFGSEGVKRLLLRYAPVEKL